MKELEGKWVFLKKHSLSQHQIQGRIRSEADFREEVLRRPIGENARNITHDNVTYRAGQKSGP